MGSIIDKFAAVFRDYATAGVSSSGPHNVVKSEVREIGPLLETAINNAALGALVDVVYSTRAGLNADLAHAANTVALVYGDATDANNDLYIKVGGTGTGSWTLTTALHDIIGNLAQPYVDAAQAISDALAAYLLMLDGVTGYGPAIIGYTGNLAQVWDGGVAMTAAGGSKKYTMGQAVGNGPLEKFEIGVSTFGLGSGVINLLIHTPESVFPDLEVASSHALTVGASGEVAFTDADFGTIDLVTGQYVGYSIPSGSITLLGANPGTPITYSKDSPASLTSGTDTFSALGSASMFARFTQGVATLQVKPVNFDPEIASLPYFGNPAPAVEKDVIVIFGDSIAQGSSGEAPTIDLDAGIASQFYGGDYDHITFWPAGSLTEVLKDPVGNANGSSPWPAFARRYWAQTGRGCIFVPVAVGGSTLISPGILGVDNWAAAGSQANLRAAAIAQIADALAAIEAANLPNRFGGFVAHLGANDAARYDHHFSPYVDLSGNAITGATFLAELQSLVSDLRDAVGKSRAPFVYIPPFNQYTSTLTAGQLLVRQAWADAAEADGHIHSAYDGGRLLYDQDILVNGGHPSTATNDQIGTMLAECAAKVFVG